MKCELMRPLYLSYTGFYGRQKPPQNANDYKSKVKRINQISPIDTIDELFRVLECIPSLENV